MDEVVVTAHHDHRVPRLGSDCLVCGAHDFPVRLVLPFQFAVLGPKGVQKPVGRTRVDKALANQRGSLDSEAGLEAPALLATLQVEGVEDTRVRPHVGDSLGNHHRRLEEVPCIKDPGQLEGRTDFLGGDPPQGGIAPMPGPTRGFLLKDRFRPQADKAG